MTNQEKEILAKERKKIKGFIQAIRTENNAIGKRLASVIAIVGSLRTSQLGINVILEELEKKLG